MDIATKIGNYKSCLELTSCHLRLHNIQIFGFGKSSARKEESSPSTTEIQKGKSLSMESEYLVELIQSGPLPRALNLEGRGHRGTTQCFYQALACLHSARGPHCPGFLSPHMCSVPDVSECSLISSRKLIFIRLNILISDWEDAHYKYNYNRGGPMLSNQFIWLC